MGERRSFSLKKGLDLPISGDCAQTIDDVPAVTQVAVVGPDHHGLRPTMAVQEGDDVTTGQLLFEDKRTPGVKFTSPGGGKVVAINRGAKRALQSVVIELSPQSQEQALSFDVPAAPAELGRDQIKDLLVESGLWTALRARPFSKVPTPDTSPRAIFVTATDTNPLAADPSVATAGHEEDFAAGVRALAKLTDGELFVCKAPGSGMPEPDGPNISIAEFGGPHPAGLAGTHIHFLEAVGVNKTVFWINYQDTIAIGKLLTTGRIWTERVLALGGPIVNRPRLLRTRVGARISELTTGQVEAGHNRLISGPVLSGRAAEGPGDFLGRYHLQISAVSEGTHREFLGWQDPGLDKFSVKSVFLSKLLGNGKRFDFTTSTQGSVRAMVPIGSFEGVMPLDTLPTFLLRALIVGDVDRAQDLGCLELDEEDLGLCTFVCPGKINYGPLLRKNLETIEKEG